MSRRSCHFWLGVLLYLIKLEKFWRVNLQKGEMNTCQSMDFVGADNITTSKGYLHNHCAFDPTFLREQLSNFPFFVGCLIFSGTVCCCDDDWCNKAAFGVHSLAIPLLIVSAVKWIVWWEWICVLLFILFSGRIRTSICLKELFCVHSERSHMNSFIDQ